MITRFAPSPTGPLHLGHAYSALLAQEKARAQGGAVVLRIEDIDQTRARPEWETQIYDDLQWLDFAWSRPVLRQSDRMGAYKTALQHLWDADVLYPCTCTRRDIQAALSAPQEGVPASGPDGLIYPGTCRNTPRPTLLPPDTAIRLDIEKAMARIGADTLSFTETGSGPNGETGTITFSGQEAITTIGDIVLARLDMGTSYHLSVVLDDAAQGVTDIVRGHDLFEATKIHVVIQWLLGLSTPTYDHHDLIRDDTGKRLAKRDDARSIAKYRDDGATPDDIRALVGL